MKLTFISIVLFVPEMLQTCKSLKVVNISSNLNICPYFLSIKKSKFELPEDEFYIDELDTEADYSLSKVDEEDAANSEED